METSEEQRRSSWASRLAEAHREHLHGRMRPLRRDAEEHQRRILEAARKLFAEQGVEAVSMRQIALAAGVGQGTLYRCYAHKGDLCLDLLRDRYERFMDEISAMLAASASAPALTRLESVLAHMVHLLEEQGAMLEAIATSHMHDQPCDEDERMSERHHGMRNAPWYRLPHEIFVGLLSEAVARDELLPLDAEYTADAIMAALNPMFYRSQRQELGYSQERILQGLRRIFVTGIQPT
ncbi:MAG TPA: helix-turn-helix domain-containing protein [Ktedonobacterales bacterium]|nr:helix-turn-helix domain-containing protein [Ktedonobacterales bacterium]